MDVLIGAGRTRGGGGEEEERKDVEDMAFEGITEEGKEGKMKGGRRKVEGRN